MSERKHEICRERGRKIYIYVCRERERKSEIGRDIYVYIKRGPGSK